MNEELALTDEFSYIMRSEGLEPPTYKFVACCSIQLSYDRTLRRERDSNPRYTLTAYDGLANRCLQPLGHLSASKLTGHYAPLAARLPS